MDKQKILDAVAEVVGFEGWRREIGALAMTAQVLEKHPLAPDLLLEVLQLLGVEDAEGRVEFYPYRTADLDMILALCRMDYNVVRCDNCQEEVKQVRPHEDDRYWLDDTSDEALEVTVPELGLSGFLCADCISKLSRFF